MIKKKTIKTMVETHSRAFDTHKHIKALVKSGFKEVQAEVLVNSLVESREYDFSKLATKEQLTVIEERLERKISEIKYDLLKWIMPFLLAIVGMVASTILK